MRRKYSRILTVVFLAAITTQGQAQTTQANGGKLAFIIPGLYGPEGLTLPNPEHEAHFDSAFRTNFTPFNASIASQLTSMPIPSPASGFIYSLDKTLGVYKRSAQSFGPILAERAETIGKGKFYFGFTNQHFSFDNLDKAKLERVPSVFTHLPVENPDYVKDIITTNNFVDIQLNQTTTFFTFGLTDRLDVSAALPLVRTSLTVVSDATIQRIGTSATPGIHAFPGPNNPSQAQFSGVGSASGIGDIILRLKGTVAQRQSAGLALGMDFRLPTGDPYDFLGSGAAGFKPFAALSFHKGIVSPHINLAYQWNTKSPLAGDVTAGEKRRLPDQIFYVAGADVGVSPKLTVAFDVLGITIRDAGRVQLGTFTAANQRQFPTVSFYTGTLNSFSGAGGLKINPIGSLLVTFNVLFKMNDSGLRDRVTPLIGVSYTF